MQHSARCLLKPPQTWVEYYTNVRKKAEEAEDPWLTLAAIGAAVGEGRKCWAVLALRGGGTEIGRGHGAGEARGSAGATWRVSVCRMVLHQPCRAFSILPSPLLPQEPAFPLLPWQRLPEVLLRVSWTVSDLSKQETPNCSIGRWDPEGLSCQRKGGRWDRDEHKDCSQVALLAGPPRACRALLSGSLLGSVALLPRLASRSDLC